MWCPKCNHAETKVTDTRISSDHLGIRRRRKCLSCGYKFSTVETYCKTVTIVEKRDGKEEEFDSDKIISSLKKAIKHDENLDNKISILLSKILSDLDVDNEKRIQSLKIGQVVMENLKQLDPIAYLRFASIYKDFQATHQFEEEFKNL